MWFQLLMAEDNCLQQVAITQLLFLTSGGVTNLLVTQKLSSYQKTFVLALSRALLPAFLMSTNTFREAGKPGIQCLVLTMRSRRGHRDEPCLPNGWAAWKNYRKEWKRKPLNSIFQLLSVPKTYYTHGRHTSVVIVDFCLFYL